MTAFDPQDWKTTEMIRAERDLDDAVERAAAHIRRVDDELTRLDAEEQPLTDAQVEHFRQTVTGPTVTPQWKWIAQRVADGTLTWRVVADGSAMVDQDVAAAWNSIASVRAYSISDEPARPVRRPVVESDDDYFDNYTVFRRDRN